MQPNKKSCPCRWPANKGNGEMWRAKRNDLVSIIPHNARTSISTTLRLFAHLGRPDKLFLSPTAPTHRPGVNRPRTCLTWAVTR